jgi:hypothetical protein
LSRACEILVTRCPHEENESPSSVWRLDTYVSPPGRNVRNQILGRVRGCSPAVRDASLTERAV